LKKSNLEIKNQRKDMSNKYLSYISDEDLLKCIGNLHKTYIKAKRNLTKKDFYDNKVDTFKLTFDANFNNISENKLIEIEILRQMDKSINNSIGTFHEQVLGSINGFEVGKLSGFDIKAQDNTLFADLKNKHNTMNSSAAESLYQKLKKYADEYKKAKCYWVQILAKSSFNEKWTGNINGKEYSHSRVYKISGDQFYHLLTGETDALYQLYKSLPIAINDYLTSVNSSDNAIQNSAFAEIIIAQKECGKERTILDQISFENFGYYLGFDSL